MDVSKRQLKHQLKELGSVHKSINPSGLWIEENKKRLMAQITNTVGAQSTVSVKSSFKKLVRTFLPTQFLAVMRPAFTAAMVLVLAFAGWAASVSASFNSLPGDVLWNVKVAAEKTDIALTTSKEEKIKKQLEYNERRVDEVKTVFENNDKKSTDKNRDAAKKELAKVKESVKDAVKSADDAVRETAQTDPDKAVQLALVVGNKADNISAGLDELKEVADKTGDAELVQQVVDTAKETSETAYIPVKSVLEISTQPIVVEDAKVQEEVKQLVSVKLDGLLENNLKVMQIVQGDVGSGSATSTHNAPAGTSTSTTDTQANNLPVTEPLSAEVINKITSTTQAIEKSAQEVRGLIEEGKLEEAIDRIQNLDQITNDAEAILKPNTTSPTPSANVMPATGSSTSTMQAVPKVTKDEQVLAPITETFRTPIL